MYYIARSTTAETGDWYEVTYVAPSTTAGLTALDAWVTANPGNARVNNVGQSTAWEVTELVVEGFYVNTTGPAVSESIAIPASTAARRAECVDLLRSRLSEARQHFQHLEAESEQDFLIRRRSRLIAFINIDANLNSDAGWDTLKAACNQDQIILSYYADTRKVGTNNWYSAYSSPTDMRWYTFDQGSATTRNGVARPAAEPTSVLPSTPTAQQVNSADILKFLEVV